jgi:hypothetical protein
MARRRNGKAKNSVTNVRVLDEYAGTDGARLDRMLTDLQNSQSQTRVEIGFARTLSLATGPDQNAIYSHFTLRGEDEWTTMSSQWQMYRVRAIRFDIYDINPSAVCFSAWSTFHESSQGVAPSFTFQQVLDGPDAQLPTNGAPKLRFTWFAKGTAEMQFQNVDDGAQDSVDYGGLRWSIGAGVAGSSKFQVVGKAIVDFRGRY